MQGVWEGGVLEGRGGVGVGVEVGVGRGGEAGWCEEDGSGGGEEEEVYFGANFGGEGEEGEEG